MTSIPTRQALPVDQAQAQAEQSYWEANLALAQVKFEVARRQMERAQAELDIVKRIAAGDFEPDKQAVQPIHREHAVGSHGPWGWTA